MKSSARHLSSLVCSAAAATALVVLGAANAGASASSGAGEPTHVGLSVLRSSYYMGSLGVLGGRIVVGDETGGATCRLAFVQPRSLGVIPDGATPCNDPRLTGEGAAPVESLPRVGSQTGVVRIATWDRGTGTVHLGPVIMRYGNYSDSRPEWTYGGGFLWLYDVGTPSGAEVLRVSVSTGQVLATVKMPGLSRLVLSAGADGLWMGQSVETGWPSGKPRPPLLYFVGVHTTKPEVVPEAGLHVDWLLASGHGAWADVQTGKGFRTPFGSLQANLVYAGAAYVLMGNQGATEAALYRIPL